jgi:hypothetical protein
MRAPKRGYSQGIHRVFTGKTGDLFPRIKGAGIVGGNDNTHYAYHCRRHHDRAVTGLWLVSLHDGKRGTRQISQGASLLARQRTLLE